MKPKIIRDLLQEVKKEFPQHYKMSTPHEILIALLREYEEIISKFYEDLHFDSGFQYLLSDLHYVSPIKNDEKYIYHSNYKGMWTMFVIKNYLVSEGLLK